MWDDEAQQEIEEVDAVRDGGSIAKRFTLLQFRMGWIKLVREKQFRKLNQIIINI